MAIADGIAGTIWIPFTGARTFVFVLVPGRAVTVNDLMTAMWDGWPAATACQPTPPVCFR